MAELSDKIHCRIQEHCAKGDELLNSEQFDKALAQYESAWKLLPEPKTNWDAALWIMAAIGDTQFQKGEFKPGRDVLMNAMKSFNEAPGNPFLRLRLGPCMLELGEEKVAANWLSLAFVAEGLKLFEGEDKKYVAFVKSKLDPPPGGWPKGW